MNTYMGTIAHTPGMAYQEGGMGRETNELQSPLFPRLYDGSDIISHGNVGLRNIGGVEYQVPSPLWVANDIAQRLPNLRDRSGNEVPNPGSGLAYERKGDPEEPAWVTTVRDFILPALDREDALTLWLMDRHFNPNYLDRNAVLRYKIDLKQLTKSERATVKANPVLNRKASTGEFITVGEYEDIFGPIVDKEDINFLPHCWDGEVRWIPSIENRLVRRARLALQNQQSLGLPRPIVRDVEDYKTGLNPVSPPDANGLNDNVIAHLFRNAWQGIYTDGPHRWWKTVIHIGTAGEYTNDFVTNFAVDQGAIVIRFMPACGMLGFDSAISTAYTLSSRYPKNFFPTWEWIPELMGPEPAGFRSHSRRMADAAYDEVFGQQGSNMRMMVKALESANDQSMEASRLINMYNLRRFDGKPLFWGARELIDHLKAEGN